MIRNGEKTAVFENLVKTEREKAIGWLKSKFGRFLFTECEDIFQEACVALWRKMASMEDWAGQPMNGMLYRICRNVATHHLQQLPLTEEWDETCESDERMVEVDFGYVSPDVYRMMQKERLYGLIDRLGPTDRALMLMCLSHESQKDICDKLKFSSVQVVKNRKGKIVGRLRKEIGGQEFTCPLFLFLTFFAADFDNPTKMRTFAA